MKKIILSYSIFTTALLFAQKDIEIINRPIGKTYVVTVKNNTRFRQEVEITITGSGYQTINSPITKKVNKGETLDFVTIQPKGSQNYTFNTNYVNQSDPTPEEKADFAKLLDGKQLSVDTDLSTGLFVFTKERCSRSERILSYLLDNQINFKFANTSQNTDLQMLMWEKLRSINVTKNIIFPVVIYNGKITYSHKNLNEFLKTLK